MRIKLKNCIPFVLLLVPAITFEAPAEGLLGDGDDGNRSGPVHEIRLYDKKWIAIKGDDEQAEPFSLRKTCGRCHSYETISSGWHFNSADPNVPAGRRGEPWVLVDADIRMQIPISGRAWPGTFKPEQINLGPWQFLKCFGTHNPGGGYAQRATEQDLPEAILKGEISGNYQINCLTCHSADPSQNQSDCALQAAQMNYEWVATGGCGFASVKGDISALSDFFDPEEEHVTVSYDKSRFNEDNEVFIDVIRRAPANRCYFCHSTQNLAEAGQMEWTRDEDVHLTAGLTCVDCHRNGLNHMITRGLEGKAADNQAPSVTTLSCKGCHLGDESAADVQAVLSGRLGAPRPEHAGIPPIHFEKLTCTACHSGPWPEEKAGLVKTARIHKLGLHDKHSVDLKLPHIAAPVFAIDEDGKIGPHKMMWPAFWGRLKDQTIVPLLPEVVKDIAADVLGLQVEITETINDWKPLTVEQIAQVLKLVQEQQPEQGAAVYICGGKLYRLDDKGRLAATDHEVAEPYCWPIAHDVRPAAQSLGSRSCEDCHATDAPFFFGQVAVDSPIAADKDIVREMTDFEQLDRLYVKAFAFSFVFRPWLKVVTLASSAALAGVLILYVLRALICIAKWFVAKD